MSVGYDKMLDVGPSKGLSPRHEEIARRVVSGQRLSDIATEMDLTENWLYVILRSPMMQAKVKELSGELDAELIGALSRMKHLSHDAVDVVEGVLRHTSDEKLRSDTAWKVLTFVMPDRGGAAAPTRDSTNIIQAENVNILQVSDPKELDRIWTERMRMLEEQQ